MIFCLSTIFEDAKTSVDVARRNSHHLQILRRADVVGAATGDQNSTRTQHLERPQIELFVAPEGGVQVGLALGEGGRVEHDSVVAAPGIGVVPQEVKRVGFDHSISRLFSAALRSATSSAGRELSTPVTLEQP